MFLVLASALVMFFFIRFTSRPVATSTGTAWGLSAVQLYRISCHCWNKKRNKKPGILMGKE